MIHTRGVLTIPAHLNVQSAALYEFLLHQFSERTARQINPDLAEHLRGEIETFGEDRVWAFAGRHHMGRQPSLHGRFLPAVLGMLLASVVWTLIAALFPALRDWGGIGVVLGFISLVTLLAVSYTHLRAHETRP